MSAGLISRLKRRHAATTPRERALLAGLASVLLLLALSHALRRCAEGLAQLRADRAAIERAQGLAAAAAEINAALAKATVAGAAKITGTGLLAWLDTESRACGLAVDAGTPQVERRGRTELHKLRLTLRGVTMEKLMAFDDRLAAGQAGLNLTKFTLESRDTEGGLTATYELTLCRLSE